MMFLTISVSAQDIYSSAENAYKIGRIDSALVILKSHENSFQGTDRQKAYRLISLCCLALDMTEESEKYAGQLLKENKNYYGSLQDPVRFVDMINRLREGRGTTIKTASGQEELIEEAPVPVTIITREMIDMLSNNRNIGQILAAYVPGISEICTYAFSNVAMHGVYTNGQEKILVMENGHRLNARSTNNGKLDYAISTEKIDHIEVLRGPASSLYGNVALTAVVNIITKRGNEINGVKGKYGYGTFGTHRADLVAGATFLGADVMAWASLYTSEGERLDIPKGSGYSQTQHDGYVYVGRYEGRPSFDVGFNLQLNDFTLMLNRKSGKLVPQYSWYAETYDYDRFRQFCGVTPGYSIDETHLNLSYNKDFSHSSLNMTIYGDWYKFQDYQAVSDSMITYEFKSDGSGTPVIGADGKPVTRLYHGVFQDDNWEEYTIGATAKFSTNYHIGKTKGNLLAGAQFEFYRIPINEFFFGEDYNRFIIITTPESPNQLNVGHEKSISGFIQNKHYFTDQLILNAGLRYDKKYRRNDMSVEAFSPRVALVYVPSKTFSVKASYSRSFVDAPYFYRQNTQNTYKGSEDLMPEYMNAIQLDFLGSIGGHFDYDVNLFYNHLTDLICNNQSTDLNAPKYVNSGSLKVAGIETELSYKTTAFRSRLNTTFQRAMSAEQYYYYDHHIYSIPSVTANLACEQRLFDKKNHSLWLSGNLRYTSRTLNKANSRVTGSEDFYLNERALVDLRLKYDYNKTMQLSLDCDNVFNTCYEIGGTSYIPYRYPGRTLMGTVAFKL
ncbi:TonB-dependent receptor [uncultured Prevotella sp.]|uniref:TonB-dependent receptor plug domain-containing protein n=1 Tax=uncultured Prevotella sp. TaxID=159272 RepID=UPI002587F3F4|nr:TonB-dependent receptor [uncultured Prevotella sp.]